MKFFRQKRLWVALVFLIIIIVFATQRACCQAEVKTVAKARAFTGKYPSSVPQQCLWYRDIEYANVDGKKMLLDLYIPKQGAGPWPLVVWIHGGGWMEGSKMPPVGAWLSAHGFAVASINYRLSTDAHFPAQIHDCKAAIRWLRANAGVYDIDPEKIAAFGESAGGHLAALLAVSGGDKDLEGSVGDYDCVSSSVSAAVNCFGPVDLTKESESDLDALDLQAQMASKYVVKQLLGPVSINPDKKRIQASVKTYIDPKDPPFLIIHGDKDPIVPVNQSKNLNKQLLAAGVKSELIIMKNGGHMFFHDKSIRKRIEVFLNKTLKKSE